MAMFGVEETAVGRMAIDVLVYLGEMVADYLVGSTKKIGAEYTAKAAQFHEINNSVTCESFLEKCEKCLTFTTTENLIWKII